MNSPLIKPRAVVRYHSGVEGIVRSREPAPAQDWIDDQINVAEIRRLGHVEWWGVWPFTGGLFLAPAPLLSVLRDASYEDFLSAADMANTSARKGMAQLFPEYIQRVLTERRQGEIYGRD
jgi:hypothetical protein